MTRKFYFALSDTFTGDNPQEYTTGFCNTKVPIVFNTKSERENWIFNTKLLTARKLTKKEAISLAKKGNYTLDDPQAKAVRIYGTGGDYAPETQYIKVTGGVTEDYGSKFCLLDL